MRTNYKSARHCVSTKKASQVQLTEAPKAETAPELIRGNKEAPTEAWCRQTS